MNPLHIFCDFDGTITDQDTLEVVLEEHAPPLWRELEEEMLRGELSELEGLRRQMELVETRPSVALETIRRRVKLRAGFPEMIQRCRELGIPLVILSGGFESIIRSFLESMEEPIPEIRANEFRYGGRWEVEDTPFRSVCPGCNHCKSVSLLRARAAGQRCVMVGDGLTDLCAAFEADLVLARGGLAKQCTRMGRRMEPFEDFHQVMEQILRLHEGGEAPGPARVNPIMARYGFTRSSLMDREGIR